MEELMALLLFLSLIGLLLFGYPVAFSLSGAALAFAGIGYLTDTFDTAFLEALPNRLYGIMTNETLIAVPLFVFMGVMLERSRVAEKLLDSMAMLFGPLRGGIGISVCLVGMLLAASTGIVGATVVTMGLLSLPTMLRRGYDPALATGTICASGTLGQIIPPSSMPPMPASDRPSSGLRLLRHLAGALIPPLALIVAVLGSIIGGVATPTEAASVGAVGALILAASQRQLKLGVLIEVMRSTTQVTSMVFLILVGASVFSLVFRGFGGDDAVHEILVSLPGGTFGAVLVVMLLMFVLGFVLDFIEITFVVVPIVGPVLLAMGLDPVWLGVMIAQTSFLTPPFGFALFYLRGVAPEEVRTTQIYRGVAPFIVIQLGALALIALWPQLATWLPQQIYGG